MKIIIYGWVKISVSDPLFFFTEPDPDQTQKPKADPDPGKSTSLEAIFDRKTIIITRIRIRHL